MVGFVLAVGVDAVGEFWPFILVLTLPCKPFLRKETVNCFGSTGARLKVLCLLSKSSCTVRFLADVLVPLMWRRLNLQEAPDMHISDLGVENSCDRL